MNLKNLPNDVIQEIEEYKNVYNQVYVLLEHHWEDMKIFLDKEEAIKESIRLNTRIEIFDNRKNKNGIIGLTPTYKYIKNGKFYP